MPKGKKTKGGRKGPAKGAVPRERDPALFVYLDPEFKAVVKHEAYVRGMKMSPFAIHCMKEVIGQADPRPVVRPINLGREEWENALDRIDVMSLELVDIRRHMHAIAQLLRERGAAEESREWRRLKSRLEAILSELERLLQP